MNHHRALVLAEIVLIVAFSAIVVALGLPGIRGARWCRATRRVARLGRRLAQGCTFAPPSVPTSPLVAVNGYSAAEL